MRYSLHKFKFNSENEKYYAKVIFQNRIDEDAMVDRIFHRGSTLTKTDIKAVLMSLTEEIKQCLINGESITLPFANYKPVIKGVFHNDRDKFNHHEHIIACSITPGKHLSKLPQSEFRMQRVDSSIRKPQLKQIFDIKTGSSNKALALGSMASITGNLLHFDPGDSQQGIFFIQKYRVSRVKIIGTIKAKELIFSVPEDLTPGEYRIEVRALFGKEIRKGAFESLIIVE